MKLAQMDIQTPFESLYRVEPARELPSSGTGVVYFPPRDVTPRIYEMALFFERVNAAPWYGVFAARSRREGGLTFSCTMPDPDWCCVCCLGTAYSINTAQPSSEWKEIQLYPVLQMLPIPDRRLLLLSSFTKIGAFGRTGLIWTSGHLASDRLRMKALIDTKIECTGWDAAQGREICFEVDLFSGLLIS
jgi:hypothetical protein